MDITNGANTSKFIAHVKPDVIVNCAAFSNVDACETQIPEAFAVNATGAKNVALAGEKQVRRLYTSALIMCLMAPGINHIPKLTNQIPFQFMASQNSMGNSPFRKQAVITPLSERLGFWSRIERIL